MRRCKYLAVLAVAVGLVVSGCGGNSRSSHPAAGTGQLRDLTGIEQLRSLFNQRSKEPQLIVLVSPT